MIIERNLLPYVVLSTVSIEHALEKISANKSKFVICLTEEGSIEGTFTDGDFRRWATQYHNADLQAPVSRALNKNFTSRSELTPIDQLEALLSERIAFIPLVDKQDRLVAIVKKGQRCIAIGNKFISEESPAFIIAEIGINHNGCIATAKKMVDMAVWTGADCAKFQMRDMKTLYTNAGDPNDSREDLGSQYTLDVLSKSQLTKEEMWEIFDYCHAKNIIPLCTPWDINSLAILEAYGMDAYKVASADLTNHHLLTAIAATGKPALMSTGMSSEAEVIESVNLMKNLSAGFMLLHCNSTYPAPYKDVNLLYMKRLTEIAHFPVGYSGHERGYIIPLAAVALGAKVIEKHFTLDKNMEGNDHKVSLEPTEFKEMVEGIRNIEQALGNTHTKKLTQGELMNRETLAKSLVAVAKIKEGTLITDDMIAVKSPGKGLQPNMRGKLVGKIATRDLEPGDFFFQSDLSPSSIKARHYNFRRPWGLPVRYHDHQHLLEKSNIDFLEFHFSYKDLEMDINKVFKNTFNVGLVTHSPDLFAGDHLLNLAEQDAEKRNRSIQELQKVIDITRRMGDFFKVETAIPIVASLGGFSRNQELPYELRSVLYDCVADSLNKLNCDGVEILPQTLPPFPWYFGGQLFCNLFVDAEDTVKFVKETGMRLCLDISHSKLACNHRGQKFEEFVEQLGPYVGHLHIVDAKGLDGEGLQINEGEIDFETLAGQLDTLCPNIRFIPEIWQGHKNSGEGFWVALDRLEKWL